MTDPDALLDEQVAYYRARAPEYEQWWHRQGRYQLPDDTAWTAEVAALHQVLGRFAPAGSVLELACGTGIWTRELAQRPGVDSVTAVDASPETIELNRARLLGGGAPVRFVKADVFGWEPDRRFDVVFFSFWLTHVPPARFDEFWALVARALAPGGQFLCFDNASGRHITDSEDFRGEGVTRRQLLDGREFDIVKVYYRPDELTERLEGLGWRAHAGTTGDYFLHAWGGRAADD